MLLMCHRTSRFVAVNLYSYCIIGLFSWAAPAVAGQGAGNPAGITGMVTDNSGAYPWRDGHGDRSRAAGPFGHERLRRAGRVPPVAAADRRLRRCSRAPGFRKSGGTTFG